MTSASGRSRCTCRWPLSGSTLCDPARDRPRHIASMCSSADNIWRRWWPPPPSTNWNEAAAPYESRYHATGLSPALRGGVRVLRGRATGRSVPGFCRLSTWGLLSVAWPRRYLAHLFATFVQFSSVPAIVGKNPGSHLKPWCSTLVPRVCEVCHTRSNFVPPCHEGAPRRSKALAFVPHAERGDGGILSRTCSAV